MGQGWCANATIGRAIRLRLGDLGGGPRWDGPIHPWSSDKYTSYIAVTIDQSP
jgi:hypothetical protein